MPSKMENFGFLLTRMFATTRAKRKSWPHVPGKYFVIDPACPVAVTTLGSVELAETIASHYPQGLNIVGKVETENIGIEKIIKNVISNPSIRYLLCVGKEPPKHLTGATIKALFENGIGEDRKILGSPGMRPVLPNTSRAEVDAFCQQVELVDMIGCTDIDLITAKIKELALSAGKNAHNTTKPGNSYEEYREIQCVVATGTDPNKIKLDKAGYFVINVQDRAIMVEHYDYRERLIRVIEGKDARSIYLTVVRNGWVSALDHAAYLGKELARAEYCIKHNIDYVQDGA